MKYLAPAASALALMASSAMAQNIELTEQNFTFSGEKAEFSSMYGKKCISLNRGRAEINDLTFTNGTIEYDVAFDQSRSFVDVHFRSADMDNAEKVYIRPHQSGNPDANQYTPVYHGSSAWQLYHHGFGSKVNYRFDDWNHVKIKVSGKQGQVFINDMTTPVITINEFLGPANSGSISFGSSNKHSCYTNIKVTKEQNPAAIAQVDSKPLPQGLIRSWQVSETFSKDMIIGTELKTSKVAPLAWTPFDVDRHGILNMARAAGPTDQKHTAFAKTVIRADNTMTKALELGFSDQATVYLNGKKIYQGDNTFRSRDYRYLGTVGLFDTLYLPLKKGENELLIAVSESFGGWGLTATLN